jgi:hypothetical protein
MKGYLTVDKLKNPKNNRIMQIIICISVAIFLLCGIILATVMIAREATAFVKYEGIYLSKGEVNYFASRYKARYISELREKEIGVYDNELFWNFETDVSGKTYGEILNERTKQYIAEIVYAAALFEKHASLSKANLEHIDMLLRDKLTAISDGSISGFNTLTEDYGFTYDNMKNALTVEYKAALARAAVYGSDGSNVSSLEPILVPEYLDKYSHVKLLFIDYTGLSQSESDAKDILVGQIRDKIENCKNGLDNAMTPTAFDMYLNENNDGDKTFNGSGCYFKDGTRFTESFRESYPTVLEKALSMNKGFDEIDYGNGFCFIYKYDVNISDLLITGNADTLDDFYYCLSIYAFDKKIVDNFSHVSFTEKYATTDVVNIKTNGMYGVNLR